MEEEYLDCDCEDCDCEEDDFDSVFKGTIRGFGGIPMSGLATLVVEDENGMMNYLHCDNGQTARSLEMAFGDVIDGFAINENGGHIGQPIYYSIDFMGCLEWFIPEDEAPDEFVEEYNRNKGIKNVPDFAM